MFVCVLSILHSAILQEKAQTLCSSDTENSKLYLNSKSFLIFFLSSYERLHDFSPYSAFHQRNLLVKDRNNIIGRLSCRNNLVAG